MTHPVAWIMLSALGAGLAGLVWELESIATTVMAWDLMVSEPAMSAAWTLSIWIAVSSTLLSLTLARYLTGWLWDTPGSGQLQLILAVPHGAVALGLLWLIAPSGLVMRWLAAPLGLHGPGDWSFPQDPWGLGLIVALTLKETIFLTIMALAVLARLPDRAQALHAASLGWSRQRYFHTGLWPQVRQRLTAPILVVFAFGLTNLELSVILAPDVPGTVAPRLYRLITDADPDRRAAGAVGAIGLFLATLAVSAIFVIGQRSFEAFQRRRLRPSVPSPWLAAGVRALLVGSGMAWIGVVASLFLWAVAGLWPFDQPWPMLDLPRTLDRLVRMWPAVTDTLLVGLVTASLALMAAIWVLESMARSHQTRLPVLWWWLLWIPALPLPAGLLSTWLVVGGTPGLTAVVLGHWLIACPYALIVLAGPWLSRTDWERQVVQMRGLPPIRALRQVWIPAHAHSLALAFAVAFSVSCALFTQTLMLGGGRVETLATELVVTLASDRRLAALAALANTLLPAMVFLIASRFRRPGVLNV